MTYAAELRRQLPEGLSLPDPIAKAMDWLEQQGWDGVLTRGDQTAFSSRYLSIYPADERDMPGASYVMFRFEAGPPLHHPGDEPMARIATIAKIAGDGGTLSLWLDEAGEQRFVVFNHGFPYVLTADPVIALQFLAIGYVEPGAVTKPNRTPAKDAGDDALVPPLAFRDFVETTFDVRVPDTAADLGITIPAETAMDPIRVWLAKVMPEPDPAETPGMTPENPYIITAELRKILGADGVKAMRGVYPYVIEAP